VRAAAVRTEDTLRAGDTADAGSLLTPLPGTVVAVHVAVGDAVLRAAPLITVEAMKMEHTLTAPRDGVIGRIVHCLGERVAAGAVLIELVDPGS
jgi:biotin carboxyl carrier protein